MSLRTKQTLSVSTGAGPTFTAATVSDTMAPGNIVWAEYRNTDVNPKTITVVTPGNDAFGVAVPDKAYTLAAGTGAGNIVPSEIRIPLIKEMQDPTTGLVTINVSGTGGVTGVTMAVVER
jgi:hypothetical protein